MPHSTPARPWFRTALLLYGALNAILYAGLLPLWDGFDEPFHYGYVQYLRAHGSLPVLGRAVLSGEIVQSLDLVPASYAVQLNLRRGVTFDTYFALPQARRTELRRELEQIDARTAFAPSQSPNYEAHQAPLAYLLLAPFDAVWSHAPLTVRILRLRLIGAQLSVLLLWLATFRLARRMGLPESIPLCVMFLVFSSQMFYATICHVANDWLAVPLLTLLLGEAISLYLQPKAATSIRLALWLAAGLLTKAYFLSAVPLVFALVALCSLRRRLPWRHAAACIVLSSGIAAPWYARNLLLYRNFTGMQETAGAGPLRPTRRRRRAHSVVAGRAVHRAHQFMDGEQLPLPVQLQDHQPHAGPAAGRRLPIRGTRRAPPAALSRAFAAGRCAVLRRGTDLFHRTDVLVHPWSGNFPGAVVRPAPIGAGPVPAVHRVVGTRTTGKPASPGHSLGLDLCDRRHLRGEADSLLRRIHQQPGTPGRSAGLVGAAIRRLLRRFGHRRLAPAGRVAAHDGGRCDSSRCTGGGPVCNFFLPPSPFRWTLKV